MERVRLFLRLREKLKSVVNGNSIQNGPKTPVSPTEPKFPIPDICEMDANQKEIVERIIKLTKSHIPVNKEPPTGPKVSKP